MDRRTGFLCVALALASWELVLPSRAYAYLDPGTGSLIIQMVAGAFLAAGMTIKLWWGHVKSVVSRLFSSRKGERDGTE